MNAIHLARAAEAMLRALGGQTVTVLFPIAADANELGLGATAAEEVPFAPVVVRSLPPDDAGRARRELLFSATALAARTDGISGEALLQSALGVRHHGRLLRIARVTPEFFAGSPYLYRVVAIE